MAKALTTEEFIKRCIKIYGNDKFRFDKTIYINTKSKVELYCNDCKKYFCRRAKDIIYGLGCSLCGINKRNKTNSLGREQIINQAESVYGKNRYDYSEAIAINSRQKIKIKCLKCDQIFYKSVHNHIYDNQGCPLCAKEEQKMKVSLSQEEFIRRVKEIHEDRFDFSSVNYINNNTKVKVWCKSCFEFFYILPRVLLDGGGHQKCSGGFSPEKYGKAHSKSFLYIIHMFGMDENFYKIGIAKQGVIKRFESLKDYNYEILFQKQLSGYDARKTEIELHKLHKKYKYCPQAQFPGHTECFSHVDFNKVKQLIKESSNEHCS